MSTGALREYEEIKRRFSKESSLFQRIRMHFLESSQTEEDVRILAAATKRYSEAQKERIHAVRAWKLRWKNARAEPEEAPLNPVILENYAASYVTVAEKEEVLKQREKILFMISNPDMRAAAKAAIEKSGESWKDFLAKHEIVEKERLVSEIDKLGEDLIVPEEET